MHLYGRPKNDNQLGRATSLIDSGLIELYSNITEKMPSLSLNDFVSIVITEAARLYVGSLSTVKKEEENDYAAILHDALLTAEKVRDEYDGRDDEVNQPLADLIQLLSQANS